MCALIACSSVAPPVVTRDEIVAAVRHEVHVHEPNTFPIRDTDIYGIQPGASGEPGRSGVWRVWVFPVSRLIGAGDSGYFIDVPDGGRELAFTRGGTLLSYKRQDISPEWLRPKNS
jgi:hypothetical protein